MLAALNGATRLEATDGLDTSTWFRVHINVSISSLRLMKITSCFHLSTQQLADETKFGKRVFKDRRSEFDSWEYLRHHREEPQWKVKSGLSETR